VDSSLLEKEANVPVYLLFDGLNDVLLLLGQRHVVVLGILTLEDAQDASKAFVALEQRAVDPLELEAVLYKRTIFVF
jgi:hypothetical protein